jgi:phosphohistidine phosphatase
MRLYFLRHGLAGDRETWTGPDADRPLTEEGRSELRDVARGLARLDLKLDGIVTSPFARAAQTAEMAAPELGLRPLVCPALASGFNLAALGPLLEAHADMRRLMLVGHEPDFSEVVGRLVASRAGASLALKKGGCCRVDIGTEHVTAAGGDGNKLAGYGTFVWLLTPKQLTLIGSAHV